MRNISFLKNNFNFTNLNKNILKKGKSPRTPCIKI